MSMLNRFKETFKKLYERRKEVIEYWNKTPTTKIIMINAGVYCMWKLNIIPEDFLVKHFAAERFNVENGRIHTLVTHAFSHHGIFSLFFDVLMIGFMGKAIQQNFPNKYIYLLYGLGALFGGLSMTVFQRPSPYIHPRIGSESSIAAFITFIGLLNPRQTFVLFVFPMPAWVLLAFLGMYSLIFDPEKKSFAGMTAGLTVYQLMRGKFI